MVSAIFLATFLFLLQAGALLNAKQCTSVDLKKQMGPIRDQGDMGWCYANTAADLLSFYYRNDPAVKGRQFSAGYIALAYNHQWMMPADFEGGFTDMAMRSAIRGGMCFRSDENRVIGYKSGRVKLSDKIDKMLEIFKNYHGNHGQTLERDIVSSFGATENTLLAIPRSEFRKILDTSDRYNFLKNFADYVCRNNRFDPAQYGHVHSRWKYMYLGKTEPLMHILHHQLADNQIPVGIGYFADFFDQDGFIAEPKERHMSTVTGREWDEKEQKCMIVVRNSWGNRCTGYQSKTMQSSKRCNSGYIRVPEETLLKYLYQIVYIDNSWLSDNLLHDVENL